MAAAACQPVDCLYGAGREGGREGELCVCVEVAVVACALVCTCIVSCSKSSRANESTSVASFIIAGNRCLYCPDQSASGRAAFSPMHNLMQASRSSHAAAFSR